MNPPSPTPSFIYMHSYNISAWRLLPQEEEEETPQMPLQPPEASVEQRFTVAVVAGGRPGFGSAAAALEGVRTLITHLHTAPRDDSAGTLQSPWTSPGDYVQA